MPCRSDHMEPTVQERQRQQAANHLIYVYERLGVESTKDITDAASSPYAGTDKYMKMLCTMLRGMPSHQRDEIVYDAHNKRSRALADWWEEHCVEDMKRAEAQLTPNVTFDELYTFISCSYDMGKDFDDIGRIVREKTGLYYDDEDSTAVFALNDGVIIYSGMDGITAYRGHDIKHES